MSSIIPSKSELCGRFVGKSLHEIPTPAAVVDVAIAKRICDRMVRAANGLGYRERHKTTELSRIQTGRDTKNTLETTLAVSTIAELEGILPLLEACKSDRPIVDILLGFLLPPTQVPRLIAIKKMLDFSTLSLLVDHKEQLLVLREFRDEGLPLPKLFINLAIDGGYSDIATRPDCLKDLVSAIVDMEKAESESLLRGFYCSAPKSYNVTTKAEAMKLLHVQISHSVKAAWFTRSAISEPRRPFILSAGSTPTVRPIQAILGEGDPDLTLDAMAVLGIVSFAKEEGLRVEIHAGDYPFVDIQQIALKDLYWNTPRPEQDPVPFSDVALTVLTEVTSVHPKSSHLIAAGTTILGDKVDQYWESYGILSGWNVFGGKYVTDIDDKGTKWWGVTDVGRDHGVLKQLSYGAQAAELVVGQKVRIVPIQAEAAARELGWYIVVDSERKGREDEVIDVWVRWPWW